MKSKVEKFIYDMAAELSNLKFEGAKTTEINAYLNRFTMKVDIENENGN